MLKSVSLQCSPAKGYFGGNSFFAWHCGFDCYFWWRDREHRVSGLYFFKLLCRGLHKILPCQQRPFLSIFLCKSTYLWRAKGLCLNGNRILTLLVCSRDLVSFCRVFYILAHGVHMGWSCVVRWRTCSCFPYEPIFESSTFFSLGGSSRVPAPPVREAFIS